MSYFHKNLNDEVHRLRRVAVNLHIDGQQLRLAVFFYHFYFTVLVNFSDLHEADAAGQEVHEEREERGHVVDLRRLSDATKSLQCGHDLLLDCLLLAYLSKVLLVYEVEETLLKRMKNLKKEQRRPG